MSFSDVFDRYRRYEQKYGRSVMRLLVRVGEGNETSLRQCLLAVFNNDNRAYYVYDSAFAAGLVSFKMSNANRGAYGRGKAPRIPTLTTTGREILNDLRNTGLLGLTGGSDVEF